MEYNVDYFDHLLRNTREYGEKIAKIRWDFVSICKPNTVLDYGSGVPWFRAFKPNNIRVDTYDIGPFPQTGIDFNIGYDLVTFWDSLEHIPNMSIIESVINKAKYIALAIPIKPDDVVLKNWKHFRPGEHLHYFTFEMLDEILGSSGFVRKVSEPVECPPRIDIMDFIYEHE